MRRAITFASAIAPRLHTLRTHLRTHRLTNYHSHSPHIFIRVDCSPSLNHLHTTIHSLSFGGVNTQSSCLPNLSSRLPQVTLTLESLAVFLQLIPPPGKRIALPTRVEPKVFFANERTFLSWLNFTVILGGLAVGLLNFGDKIGQISAGLFTVVAMAAMLYALMTFHWRAKSIRQRGQGGFDDRLGPTILALALFFAVLTNFILRFTAGGKK